MSRVYQPVVCLCNNLDKTNKTLILNMLLEAKSGLFSKDLHIICCLTQNDWGFFFAPRQTLTRCFKLAHKLVSLHTRSTVLGLWSHDTSWRGADTCAQHSDVCLTCACVCVCVHARTNRQLCILMICITVWMRIRQTEVEEIRGGKEERENHWSFVTN